jgi:signal transduction histidine kinase
MRMGPVLKHKSHAAQAKRLVISEDRMSNSTVVRDYQMIEQQPAKSDSGEQEHHRQVLQGLHEVLAILNSNRSLDDILRYLLAQACRLLDTTIGAVYYLSSEENCLRPRVFQGLNTLDEVVDLPISWGAPGQAVLTRQTVAIADTGLAPNSNGSSLPLAFAQEPVTLLIRRYRALLSIPVIIKAEVYGAIVLYYHEPHQFSPEEMQVATMLNDLAALATENARLAAAVPGKAVQEERQRIARELHDSVTQALYGISLYAEAANRRLQTGDAARVARHLHALQQTTLEALQEMRLLIFELRPPLLAQEGLVAALQTRLEAVEGRSNIETKLVAERSLQFAPPIEQALYRIVQEALNNTLKHAHAKHVIVSLRQEQSVLILEVIDDGIGFDPTVAHGNGGLGLRGIEERVSQLGGRLTVESTPGAGTCIRVEVGV